MTLLDSPNGKFLIRETNKREFPIHPNLLVLVINKNIQMVNHVQLITNPSKYQPSEAAFVNHASAGVLAHAAAFFNVSTEP